MYSFTSPFSSLFSPGKIFLDKLGAVLSGLTEYDAEPVAFSIWRNWASELPSATCFTKPIFDGNRDRIKEIVSVLAYLYRNVGLLILGAGLLLACFLPYIFADAGIRLG